MCTDSADDANHLLGPEALEAYVHEAARFERIEPLYDNLSGSFTAARLCRARGGSIRLTTLLELRRARRPLFADRSIEGSSFGAGAGA